MNLYAPPIETMHWLIGAAALAIFLFVQLRLFKELKNNPLYQLTTLLAVMAFLNLSLWSVPLIFTRDETLYTILFVIGDVFSHAMFLFSLLLLMHFLGWSYKSVSGVLTITAFIVIGIAEMILLDRQILESGITIFDDRISFALEGPGTFLYAIMYVPFLLLGLMFFAKARTAKTGSAKVRTIALGLILVPIAISFMATYLSGFFQGEPVASAQDSSNNIIMFSIFLVLNLFVLAFTSKTVQSRLNKKAP